MCCDASFAFNYENCVKNSQLIELEMPLDDPYSDDDTPDDAPLIEPSILIEFGGKLYFRNVFIPSSTPMNMRIVRDAVLNSIRAPLEEYRISRLEGKNFDGIDMGGLDEILAAGFGRRSLSDVESERDVLEDLEQYAMWNGALTAPATSSSRMLSRMQLFLFDLDISVPCPRSCADDVTAAGRSASIDIAMMFEDSILDGTVFRLLQNDMESMGLVGPFFSATLEEGFLMYQGADWDPASTGSPTSSREPTTRPTTKPTRRGRPTRRPTRRPSATPTDRPTGNHPFYPDFEKMTCVRDGKQSEFQSYLYDTMEECCKFPWLDEAKCLSAGAAGGATEVAHEASHAGTLALPHLSWPD